jgi:hypothetical protein
MEPSNPIIDEVRAVREALARESGDDIEKIVEAARRRQAESGRTVVTLPPKTPQVTKRASGCSRHLAIP